METKIHPVSEFASCPFERFTDETQGNWSWARGGDGLSDFTYTLNWVYEDLSSERWVLPEVFATMLETSFNSGKREAIRNIHRALEI